MVHSFQEDCIKEMQLDNFIISYVLSSLWVSTNYSKLEQICKRVSKGAPFDDLCQCCIEQFLKNKRTPTLEEKDKLFFFTKIVTNNYNSTSSPYHAQYRKFKFSEIEDFNIPEEVTEESVIDVKWVLNELEELGWYYKRLMELYIEEGASISKLSKRTTIPLNSVSRDINKARKFLRKQRNKLL